MENDYIKYTEYLAEYPNLVDYNKYIADNLDKTIRYTEYLSSSLMDDIDYKLIDRRNKIKKIMKRKV